MAARREGRDIILGLASMRAGTSSYWVLRAESKSWRREHQVAVDGPFLAEIQTELDRLGRSDITPTQILLRAMTQTCAGCHRLVFNGTQLGGGLVWRGTAGLFTHIDEVGTLSPGLVNQFLPHRREVLRDFLCGVVPSSGTLSGSTVH